MTSVPVDAFPRLFINDGTHLCSLLSLLKTVGGNGLFVLHVGAV